MMCIIQIFVELLYYLYHFSKRLLTYLLLLIKSRSFFRCDRMIVTNDKNASMWEIPLIINDKLKIDWV